MNTLKVGDIIRNIDPYLGESIKRIISEDDSQYYVQQGPGKHGGWQEKQYKEIIFKDRNDFYRKATRFERIWFCILGWIVDHFYGGK